MQAHGGAVRSCPFSGHGGADQQGAMPVPANAAATPAGFRHILGTPTPAQRFQVDGEDPRFSATALATLRRRMRGVAMLMGNRD
jgi:hypothetical protein